MIEPLRLYTDRACLPAGFTHSLLLIPFWGNPFQHDGLAEFEREGQNFLQLTDAADADFAVLPFDGSMLLPCKEGINPEAVRLADRFVAQARAAGLRTIVLVNSDSDVPVPLPDVIVFRTSLSRSRRLPNEFALPAWHEDLVEDHLDGEIIIRPWSELPVVGFCGHAALARPSLRRRIKLLLQQAAHCFGAAIKQNDGIHLRRQAMKFLQDSRSVKTNFLVRSTYFAGPNKQLAHMQTARREYIDNLVESDYILCVRGYGNFSFRFFEAMSVGRAPLLIDTDCVLPYAFLHDYRQFAVIVPDSQVGSADRAVTEFHEKYKHSYRELQEHVRRFWVDWLSPVGFFRNLSPALGAKATGHSGGNTRLSRRLTLNFTPSLPAISTARWRSGSDGRSIRPTWSRTRN